MITIFDDIKNIYGISEKLHPVISELINGNRIIDLILYIPYDYYLTKSISINKK